VSNDVSIFRSNVVKLGEREGSFQRVRQEKKSSHIIGSTINTTMTNKQGAIRQSESHGENCQRLGKEKAENAVNLARVRPGVPLGQNPFGRVNSKSRKRVFVGEKSLSNSAVKPSRWFGVINDEGLAASGGKDGIDRPHRRGNRTGKGEQFKVT